MQQPVNLYRYHREDGGVTVSPVKPEGVEYTMKLRLIADDGKVLTRDGVETTPCCDVDSVDGWYEIDAPNPPPSLSDATNDELGIEIGQIAVLN